jgi:carbohydrate diacid regulator
VSRLAGTRLAESSYVLEGPGGLNAILARHVRPNAASRGSTETLQVTISAGNFDEVAEAVARRMAQLLSTNAAVLDERGVVVASDKPRSVGRPFSSLPEGRGACLRVPVRLEERDAEIAVVPNTADSNINQRFVEVVAGLVINQAAVMDRLPNGNQLKNKFIHDLLLGDMRDETTILREAGVLGMDFSAPRAVILIDASDYILPVEDEHVSPYLTGHRVQRVIGGIVGFFELPDDTICAYIGEGEVAVLKASSTEDLAAWAESDDGSDHWVISWANLTALKRAVQGLHRRLEADTRSQVRIGIGRYHPGIRGLPRSYADARAALGIGRRLVAQARVHCLDSLGLAAFVGLSDESTKEALANHLLSPLDHEPELMQTLDCFFQHDCSMSLTASLLNIHRNTLAYRLEKVASLTGLDPRRFDQATRIRVAMTLQTLATE